MLVFGKNWATRFIMVSEQTCTISIKMEQSLWRKVAEIDKLHYINQTQKYRQCSHVENQIADYRLGFFEDAPFAGTVRIWISHVFSNFVDVQEANRSFSQLFWV